MKVGEEPQGRLLRGGDPPVYAAELVRAFGMEQLPDPAKTGFASDGGLDVAGPQAEGKPN